MKIGIIGLGLMGGSFSIEMRRLFPNSLILGNDISQINIKSAKRLELIDDVFEVNNLSGLDIVLISVPVDISLKIVNRVLDHVTEHTLVLDVGSTKLPICNEVQNHPNRQNFLAMHPISGTENSGPDASVKGLYTGITNIVCEKEKTGLKQYEFALSIFQKLEMKIIYMNPKVHDQHISYVSHLSHITSFILAKTVIEKEIDEKNIFDLAGSGFESTVRLAKSSPEMWSPIFIQNKNYIVEALSEYIDNLEVLKQMILKNENEVIINDLNNINRIKEILSGINNKRK
ncbi:MAG: prephenate dehydrogenase [Flavobacteriaceae bacterium]|nr:prephenate dehydrogenase [Flavobacteriaceae bacterium]|tara:strand:+ start:1927 stop:2787 length:861 start_codon:yes stop_codon:yes gene_type:complete